MELDNVNFNTQLPRTVSEDFRIAAKLRGQSMSSLVRQFMIRLIREEKELHPESFPGYKDYPIDKGAKIDIPENVQEAVDVFYETFGGDEIDVNLFRITIFAVKQMQDAQLNKGKMPTITPGKKPEHEPTRDEVQRMFDADGIGRAKPRKRKAG